jgi:hypothetical protein
MWCRDKESNWENELVRGVEAATISGERIPVKSAYRCYLPWENRWVDIKEGERMPDFKRSIVLRSSNAE